MSIVLHPESKVMLDAVMLTKPHAVLLAGQSGIGLATIASHYAVQARARTLAVLPEKDEKVNLEKGTITVESIRKLYESTKTVEPTGRYIIIDYAERMAPAAQNSFLKLLEEPTAGTQFVILTHEPNKLLPTVLSRLQRIDIRPITHEQSNGLLDQLGIADATKRAQLLFIAEGLPAELIRLANDARLFEVRATIVKDARSLVTGSPYERLLIAKKYKDSRSNALILVEDALKLLQRTIASNGDIASLRMVSRLEQLHKRLSEQGNVRLQLSALIIP